MSKHTPGPWALEKSEILGWHKAYVMSERLQVVHNGSAFRADKPDRIAEAEANARLIAAAPEMLEKLKEWADSCGDCIPEHRDPDCEICGPTIALIAKAEGRT